MSSLYQQALRSTSVGRRALLPALIAILVAVGTASAHDFWIIPDIFAVGSDAMIHASGRAGTRFPFGNAVQPSRVAEALLIGATTRLPITELTVDGKSLRLHQRAPKTGQYVIAVTLTSSPTRSTPANMLRFLKAEGGASEAARLEGHQALDGQDSVIYRATSYATAIVEVGQGGPRAYAVSTGLPLEFIPTSDPGQLHVGDTLHVRIVGDGKAVPNAGVFAGAAADTTSSAPVAASAGATSNSLRLSADGDGVLHLPLNNAGAWNLRAAYVYRRSGAAPNEWTIARTTYVFHVTAAP